MNADQFRFLVFKFTLACMHTCTEHTLTHITHTGGVGMGRGGGGGGAGGQAPEGPYLPSNLKEGGPGPFNF